MTQQDEDAIWEIEGVYPLAETVDAAAARARLLAELQRLPRMRVWQDGDRIEFRSAGRVMIGSPFNRIDKGILRIDDAGRTLAFRLSMVRGFVFCCLGVAALCGFAHFLAGTSFLALLLYAPFMFAWLWGASFFLANRSTKRYLQRLASGM